MGKSAWGQWLTSNLNSYQEWPWTSPVERSLSGKYVQNKKICAVFTFQVTTYWQPSLWPGTVEWSLHKTQSSSLMPSLPIMDRLPRSPGDMLTSQPRHLAWRWCNGANTHMNTRTNHPERKSSEQKAFTIRNMHSKRLHTLLTRSYTSIP